MKRKIICALIVLAAMVASVDIDAQFNWGKGLQALVKSAKALTLTDKQMAAYVKESVDKMDAQNQVLGEKDAYTKRLRRLTKGITDVDGIPLNFKVYKVDDVNAFACPDGSVRVFSSLMDIMSDDELLGIIGHEIGHVAKRHSKNAFRNELLRGALKDGIASAGGVAEALTESQICALGEALVGAKYSQKQEKEADDYGYEFLKSHGKNPWGMVMSFEKLSTMEDGSAEKSSYVQKMFSSHPDTQERIDRLTERAQKEGIARPKTRAAAKK